jgi:hypothetical protein
METSSFRLGLRPQGPHTVWFKLEIWETVRNPPKEWAWEGFPFDTAPCLSTEIKMTCKHCQTWIVGECLVFPRARQLNFKLSLSQLPQASDSPPPDRTHSAVGFTSGFCFVIICFVLRIKQSYIAKVAKLWPWARPSLIPVWINKVLLTQPRLLACHASSQFAVTL